MTKVGPKTDLTPEVFKLIEKAILDGKNINETARFVFRNHPKLREEEKELGEENYVQKVYNWKHLNYLNLDEKIETWQTERKLALVEKNLEEFLTIDNRSKTWNRKKQIEEIKEDPQKMKIKADITKFVAETLGRRKYHRTQEVALSGKLDINSFIDEYDKPREPKKIKGQVVENEPLIRDNQQEWGNDKVLVESSADEVFSE